MPRYRRFRHTLRRHTQTIVSDKSKRPWLIWLKLGLSASVPIMITIFTIVSYVQQMEINANNRQKDEDLANATRQKDLSIANLTRMQDQMIANITRYHDLEIANLTQIKDWEIAMANLNIANETKIQDRQIADDNRKEDRAQQQDLHYDMVYSKYIEDISTILYKQPYNQTTFTNEEKKMLYIRRKTLITLRSIDSERRSLLFVFLYENNLLPDQSSSSSTISLMGANLRDITIRSPLIGLYEFNSLSLQSVDLINAVFTDCRFRGETNFSGAIMTNVQFIGAVFEDDFVAYKVKLINASFIDCVFKKKINFEDSDLSSTHFIRSNFDRFSATAVNLTDGSFHQCQFSGNVEFTRSVMNSVNLTQSELGSDSEHRFDQVSLPFADFHNTSFTNTLFQNSSLSYADFRGAHLSHVQFTSMTLLINSSFDQATFTQVNFTHVNLSGSRIDLKQVRDAAFYNVVLPNGSWSIDNENLLRNGDAEQHCERLPREDVVWQWEEVGLPIRYHHNTTRSDSTNSFIGNCSFKCRNEGPCSMGQLINLKQFMLFIDSGELQYTLSVYFGSDGRCRQDLVSVWIVAYHGKFKRQLSNPYIQSSDNFIRWQRKDDSYKLPKNNGTLFYIRVALAEYSSSCYIDNTELRLSRSFMATR